MKSFGLQCCVLFSAISFGNGDTLSPEWEAVSKALDDYFPLKSFAFSAGNASGQQFVYSKGNVTLDTPMYMASSSKFPVATAIMGAVVDGHITLQSKPSEVWDWWTTDPSDKRSRVTLETLLSFTSGLYTADAAGDLPCLSFNVTKYSSEDCARQIYTNATFAFEPGTTWDYNSFHLQVAGAFAAAAAKTTVQDLLHKYLIGKLGMASTQWAGGANPYLAASMTTTGADYDKFLHAYTAYSLVPEAQATTMEVDYLAPPTQISNASTYLVDILGHYSFCNYFECVEPKKAPFTEACKTANIHMDAGLFGYYPLVDRANNMYMQIVQTQIVEKTTDLGPTIAATVLRELVKPLVDTALGLSDTTTQPLSYQERITTHTTALLERVRYDIMHDSPRTPDALWQHLNGLSTTPSE